MFNTSVADSYKQGTDFIGLIITEICAYSIYFEITGE